MSSASPRSPGSRCASGVEFWALSGEVVGDGLPHTIVPVSWSDTRVRYRWCLRQEISSTPMSTSPDNRSGSSTSAATRSQIAPTVRHDMRAKRPTVVVGRSAQPASRCRQLEFDFPGVVAVRRRACALWTVRPSSPQRDRYPQLAVDHGAEVVPSLVEVEVAVPHLKPAAW